MSTDITLTTEEIKFVFKGSLDSFYKKFEVKDGFCKITLDDIPKIKEIDQFSFIIVKQEFIKLIKAKELSLKNFYELFTTGLRLLNTDLDIISDYWKSKTTHEKEMYFQIQLTEFFSKVFPKNISKDAYLHGKKHSDCILYDSTNIKDLVFIEYATDIPIGKKFDMDETIIGHLNKIVKVYSKKKIEFFCNTKNKKLGEYEASQVWFIYFSENLDSENVINAISKKKYKYINIILINYNFIQSKHLIIHLKKHDEKDFKETQLQ